MKIQFTQRALILLFILTAAFSVRALTANFIRAHLDDPGWFPYGIYGAFDKQSQDWLDGRASIFWIEDATRTDKAIYAPGYPLCLAFIYKVSGSRLPQTVQNVQWFLDSLAVLLVVGVGVTAFDWRVGLCAGGIAALWPLLATYGAVPLADAPTSWLVLGATWMLLLAAKRNRVWWAMGAGALIGLSCWLRANAMVLVFFWAAALFLFARLGRSRRAILAAAVIIGGMVLISPIITRNAVAFHAFVPTGLGAGTNLLEGIGDFERGAKEFGAPPNDSDVLEQERVAANVPPGTEFSLYYPDGIKRDRARASRALSIIKHHPFWYASTVVRRMAAVMKYAGQPSGVYGSAGVNVTAKKSLAPSQQGVVIGSLVNGLGMIQSVLRYILLPLMIVGVVLAFRSDWRITGLIIATVFYYLVIGSLIHTHIRYSLPMQALLTIFAALAMIQIVDVIAKQIEVIRKRRA
ncbi:MAG TPA: glycosyltransferase family 39 protein [Pyrinomonadaceae bacterium]|jgi:4-amino-4-deoxy-L-arabinose transferase-like glycosyltransferase|nr:glycosyltransferase family 39 protein [Pyrinomonadaceae bacterium]